MGDFNGDGFLDIVEGNSDFGQGKDKSPTYVYLNDGHGSFKPGYQLGDAISTLSVAVGDLNGDGFVDIVQGNNGQSYVYLNDGQGGFARGSRLGDGQETHSMVVGDFNGDGTLDIVQGNYKSPTYVYLNDGQGGFKLGYQLGAGISTLSMAVGDFNGDGALDIVQGNDGQSYVYLNDGQGGFDHGHPFGDMYTSVTWSVAVGDFNGDGALDIVQGNDDQETGVRSYVYLNNGQGGFGSRYAFGDAQTTRSVAVGDFNSDGALDIVQGNDGRGTGVQSHVYLNNGQSGFGLGLPLGDIQRAFSVAVGDFNGDGFVDIVQGNYNQGYVYLNDSQGGFGPRHPFGGSQGTGSVAVGDFNGDDALDIIQGGAVGDFNGDGALDIVQGNDRISSYVYLNNGQGGFGPGLPLGNGQSFKRVAADDFNGDGALDIVQRNRDQGGFSDYPSYVYLNNGQGDFGPGLPLGNGQSFKSVAVGDLNGDGALDIVQGNYGSPSYVYLNNGQGGFKPGYTFGVNQTTGLVEVGDFNDDGALDIVQVNDDQSYIYLNDGQGGFGPRYPFGNNRENGLVAVGDFNGDGALDIVQGNYNQSYVYLNDGQGGFGHRLPLGGNHGTGSVAVGDFNGDGALDIVQVNFLPPSYVYLNDGQSGFDHRLPLGGNQSAWGVAVGDFNGDGALDIVQGILGSSSYVYLNLLRQTNSLVNHHPRIAVTRPGPTGDANFYSTPALLSSPTIPITYTLFDQEGDRVGRVEASYSMDGGGKWLSAIAASGTVTQNLVAGGSLVRAYLSPTLSIPTSTSSPLQAKLQITQQISVADVEVWVAITRTQNSALGIALRSPQGTQVPLVAAGQAQGRNFQATRFSVQAATSILSGTAPYIGIYQPVGNLAAFAGTNSSGDWTLVITNTGTTAGELSAWGLRLSTPPAKHTFYWDTFASGFFGQSDNVVVRLVAYSQPLSTTAPLAGAYGYTNSVPGPYQYPYVSATTFPFRVHGTQVRVMDSQNNPVPNALVYRLPRGGLTGAELMPSASQPLTTAGNGYLGGRGVLAFGDQLVALQPLRRGPNYTVYATSAAPTENGLALQSVTAPGVQTLQVSAAHPLLLFDLDVALEWDARNDDLFYAQLTTAIQRASAILYDVSDGQIALGEVRLHPKRAAWQAADVVIYANNNLRPRASMGGVVQTAQDDRQRLGAVLRNAYLPGQVRMGPVWDPFGQNNAELTQDWQRALAHELAHYLLFLPDNYLGVENGLLRITNCQGSVMTDAYNPGYSEFLTPTQWHTPDDPTRNPCLRTVAATLLTGRSDWATVTNFYRELHIPTTPLTGPALLPLNVTRVRLVAPADGGPQPVTARNYDLRDETGSVTVLRQAQAYVLQSQGTPSTTDDALLYLGSTGVGSDRILVRGALADDKVCVIDSASDPQRSGCTTVTPQSTSVQLFPVSGWRPDIQVTPISSTTFQITVTQAVNMGQLSAQLLPAYGPTSNDAAIQSVSQPLTPIDATHYTTRITTAYPVFEGFVRVYAAGAPEQQQAITQFFLADPWGPNAAWRGSANRAWGANIRSLEAPAASGDGKVTILNLTNLLADTGSTVLQAVTDLPYLPAWLTPVGAGYRFAANSALARTIMVQYNQRDVPPGYEQSLNLYYLPTGSTSWQRLVTGPLATSVDTRENLATATMPTAGRGEGIYALMATVELPALVPGWNPINYPIGTAQAVTNSLASLGDAFTTIYEYQSGKALPWPVYARTVEPAFAPLVNTLDTMMLGHNYLIYATQTVTPYIGVVGDGQAQGVVAAGQATGFLEPPALFYGAVASQSASTLQAGMTVQAKIGGVVCGESQLQAWQGQLAYVIQVKADTGDGCGRPSKPVVFEINGKPLPITVFWDNRQVHSTTPSLQIYLPMIAR